MKRKSQLLFQEPSGSRIFLRLPNGTMSEVLASKILAVSTNTPAATVHMEGGRGRSLPIPVSSPPRSFWSSTNPPPNFIPFQRSAVAYCRNLRNPQTPRADLRASAQALDPPSTVDSIREKSGSARVDVFLHGGGGPRSWFRSGPLRRTSLLSTEPNQKNVYHPFLLPLQQSWTPVRSFWATFSFPSGLPRFFCSSVCVHTCVAGRRVLVDRPDVVRPEVENRPAVGCGV